MGKESDYSAKISYCRLTRLQKQAVMRTLILLDVRFLDQSFKELAPLARPGEGATQEQPTQALANHQAAGSLTGKTNRFLKS